MKDIKVQRKLMLVLSMVFCISVISHSDMRYYINKGIKSAYLGICERLYHGMLIVADRECSKFWETIADEETWDDIDEDEYQEYESKMYQGIDDQEDVDFEGMIRRLKKQRLKHGFNLFVWHGYVSKTSYREVRTLLIRRAGFPVRKNAAHANISRTRSRTSVPSPERT